MKNTIISLKRKRTDFAGKTFPGCVHGYKILEEEFPLALSWFKDIKVSAELGYQGSCTDYICERIRIYIKNQK